MDLQLLLEDCGWRVIGPVATVQGAPRLLEAELPLVALLDVSLGNELVTPVAEALKMRAVPFSVACAYPKPVQFGCGVLAGELNVGKPTIQRLLGAELAILTKSSPAPIP